MIYITDETPWQPEPLLDLRAAVMRIERELPGWWWSVGSCHLTAHASIGPDRVGPDAELCQNRIFDEGFHADLNQPSTCAKALFECIDIAVRAKKDVLV